MVVSDIHVEIRIGDSTPNASGSGKEDDKGSSIDPLVVVAVSNHQNATAIVGNGSSQNNVGRRCRWPWGSKKNADQTSSIKGN